MLTVQQKAVVLRKLTHIERELEKIQKQRQLKEQVAKNWAAMTQVQRNAYLGAIAAKLNRLEIAIAQATRAAQPRPPARKDVVNLQAQELLRSRARKTAPAGCSGPVCGHMRTPTGGRR